MHSKNVLGVRVDFVSLDDALQLARNFLASQRQFTIFTPNPEMVVKAQKDIKFKEILNSSDLSLCDGFGLHIFSGAPRITGVDFMHKLCFLAAEEGRSVYLLGSGNDEVVKQAAEKLKKEFNNLIIAGYEKGPIVDEDSITDQSVDKIRETNPDILFVAFGMGKQEKWIYENLAKLPSVKIAMGVGGSFDYISGRVNRAPLFLRQIGLEWLYRLIRQPKRVGRILNATFKFLFLAIKNR